MVSSAELVLVLVGGALAGPPNSQGQPAVAAAQQQARITIDAIARGDWEKLIEMTYPTVVEDGGGAKGMAEGLRSIRSKMAENQQIVRAVQLGAPGELYREGEFSFVVFPFTTEITAPHDRVTVKSYLLGISSDDGKTWRFIDGMGLRSPKARKRLLPTLPKGLTLPEIPKPDTLRKPPKNRR